MLVGDVVMVRMPGSPGKLARLGPGVVVAELPGVFPSYLVVGISSRIERHAEGWDLLLEPGEPDFSSSGLHLPSVIRPSWFITWPAGQDPRVIGWVSVERVNQIRRQLAEALSTDLHPVSRDA